MESFLKMSAKKVIGLAALFFIVSWVSISSVEAARLRLIRLECFITEDNGCDEPYIKVGSRRVWSYFSLPGDEMCDNDEADLTSVRRTRFSKSINIRLFDHDFPDADDFLGRVRVLASDAGQGEREHDFTEDGAFYTLTYEVLR